MPGQDIWRRDPGRSQQGVEIGDHGAGCAAAGHGVTATGEPGIAIGIWPIVGAGVGECRHTGEDRWAGCPFGKRHGVPNLPIVACASLEDDRGLTNAPGFEEE